MARSPARMELARYVSVGITCKPSAQPLVSLQRRQRRSAWCCGFRPRSRRAHPARARASRNRRRAPTRGVSARRPPYRALDQNGIGAIALIEQRLHSAERHKDGANRSLSRAERKLAEILPREHLTHGEAHAAADVLFPAVQRLGRNRRRILHAKDHRLAGGRIELGGQPFAQQRLVRSRRLHAIEAVETARTDRRRAYTCTRDARRPLSCAATNPSATISGAACSNALRELLAEESLRQRQHDRPCPAAAARDREGWRAPIRRPSARLRAPRRQWRRRR